MPAYRVHTDDDADRQIALFDGAGQFIAALKEIHALDWTPDAAYPKQGRSVRYVTTAKIKRQITPVLDRYGLRISQTVREPPTVTETGMVLVHHQFQILHGFDPVDGPVDVWSEGVNDAGKRMLTASTNAYRIYALQTFGIIDGMEDEPTQEPTPAARMRPVPEQSPAQAP